MDVESTSAALCGGRRFGRKFSKRDYPLLGSSEENDNEEAEKAIVISRRAKERLPKKLSTSVTSVRDLYRDPKTGRWHWPVNGADLVFNNIYLGDA